MTNRKLNSKKFVDQVLKIAEGKVSVITYHDFDRLNPKPGDSHFIISIKNILISNGYICHVLRRSRTWDCKYFGPYTHFHHPQTTNGAGYSEDEIS
jgi:hypothetical protein